MIENFIVQDDVQLKIYGVDFSFDSTDMEIIQKIEDFAKESQEISDRLQDRKDYRVALGEAIQFTVDAIDSVLGEGASSEIFKGTSISINKAVGVMQHISNEISVVRKASIDKFSPKRAKRVKTN